SLVAVAPILAAFLPVITPSAARAQDAGSVDAWVTVSSSAPALGCAITMAVELRSGGYPASNSDVLVALSAGGSLVSADEGVTDSSGIVDLSVDASAGIGDRVDIMVGGQFLTGFQVNAGAGSSCDDGAALLTATGNVPIGTVSGGTSISTDTGAAPAN